MNFWWNYTFCGFLNPKITFLEVGLLYESVINTTQLKIVRNLNLVMIFTIWRWHLNLFLKQVIYLCARTQKSIALRYMSCIYFQYILMCFGITKRNVISIHFAHDQKHVFSEYSMNIIHNYLIGSLKKNYVLYWVWLEIHRNAFHFVLRHFNGLIKKQKRKKTLWVLFSKFSTPVLTLRIR